MRRTIIGVMGGCDGDPRTLDQAYQLGRLIAGRGWVLLNGGRPTGVMDASARGARDARRAHHRRPLRRRARGGERAPRPRAARPAWARRATRSTSCRATSWWPAAARAARSARSPSRCASAGRWCCWTSIRARRSWTPADPAPWRCVATPADGGRGGGGLPRGAGARVNPDFDFDRPIERRGTASVKWDRYAGRDVLPLWVADTDFASPPAVLAALRRAGRPRRLRLRPGAARAGRGGARPPAAANTAGRVDRGRPGLAARAGQRPERGLPRPRRRRRGRADEHADLPAVPVVSAGDGLRAADGRAGAGDDRGRRHALDLRLGPARAAITPATRAFLLCSPHNPCGRLWTRDELDAPGRDLRAPRPRHRLGRDPQPAPAGRRPPARAHRDPGAGGGRAHHHPDGAEQDLQPRRPGLRVRGDHRRRAAPPLRARRADDRAARERARLRGGARRLP